MGRRGRTRSPPHRWSAPRFQSPGSLSSRRLLLAGLAGRDKGVRVGCGSDEVFAHRGEQVEQHARLPADAAVLDVACFQHRVASSHGLDHTVDLELEDAADDVGDLRVRVVVQRTHRSGGERVLHAHDVLVVGEHPTGDPLPGGLGLDIVAEDPSLITHGPTLRSGAVVTESGRQPTGDVAGSDPAQVSETMTVDPVDEGAAPMPRENLTRSEARERAAVLSPSGYQVELDLTQGEETFSSRTTVHF